MENWLHIFFAWLLLMSNSIFIQGQDIGPVPDICRNKTSSDIDESERFFQCLRRSYDYSLHLRRRTEVVFSYEVEDIFYSSISGMFLSGMIMLEWQDDNFIWTEGDLPYVHSRKVVGMWKPEIYMNALSNYDTAQRLFRAPIVSDQTGGHVYVQKTGQVFYKVQASLTALCPQQDLKYFPYDVQTCRVELFTVQNVLFRTLNGESPVFLDLSPLTTSYRILEYNISVGGEPEYKQGATSSSVFVSVKFMRFDLMFWIKLYTPNLALCIFLLIPLSLSPRHVLRLALSTISFLATIYQMQTLARMIPDGRVYSGDILMVDFYRNLTILSLILLVHNFFCCLLWRRKAFLPAPLNRLYAKLYALQVCKKLTAAEDYFELDRQGPQENLETTFHTWSELLRLVDVILFLFIFCVEVYSYVPTLN